MPDKPAPLDYATPIKYVNRAVLQALIGSLLSGPVGIVIGLFLPIPDSTLLMALATLLGLAFVFAFIVRVRLGPEAPPRYRWMATISCLLPLIWGFGIATLYFGSVQFP
jgi:hypothetical protein